MRTTLMCLLLLTASCVTPASRSGSSTEWITKADRDLGIVVDRYADTDVDTVVTLVVIPSRPWLDDERTDIVNRCGLRLADRQDSTVMVICPSRAIPCLGASDLVEGMLLSPPWSPDL